MSHDGNGKREIEAAQRYVDAASMLYRSAKERQKAAAKEFVAAKANLEKAKQQRDEALSFLKSTESRLEVIHIDAAEEDETGKVGNVFGTANPNSSEESSEDEDQDSDYAPVSESLRVVTPPKKKARRANISHDQSTSDAPRRLGLNNEGPAWLEDMYDFLLHVPHGNRKKTVSEVNARAVMRQVRKLTAGHGITYKYWPAGAIFAKDRPITLSTDLAALYQEACAFEERHGKDRGNGWLLKHPIKKMEVYASHLHTTSSSAARGEVQQL